MTEGVAGEVFVKGDKIEEEKSFPFLFISSNTCSPVFSPSVVVKKIYSLSKICIYQNGIYLVPNSQNYGPDLLLDEKLLPNKFCSQNKSRASSCFPFAASYSLHFTVPSSRFSGLLSILI